MNVRVNGSTEVYHFTLFDEIEGYDKIFEFLETNCEFVAEKFNYMESEGAYVCEQEDFDRWKIIIEGQQALSKRVNSLKVEHGEMEVDEVINRAIFHSIEDEADAINYELDRAFDDD